MKIALIVNEGHEIHHVHERGYVESPVRIGKILRALERTDLFDRIKRRRFGMRHIAAVHDKKYLRYFRRMCRSLGQKPLYPYVFPIRNAVRPPKELDVRAGYYCIDTFTPLTTEAFRAAKGAVECALSGARELLRGRRFAYALVRPPGHHAERGFFGGFCYFNSSAVAAHYLSKKGRVAILDIDYHHGNGQQDIFYERRDVLTVSIHGHPSFAYPYFTGFAKERGKGHGKGYNLNIPLKETITPKAYRAALAKALRRVKRHKPDYLVVSLGLDTAKGDPTGTWPLMGEDFAENARMISALGIPTLIVQEGGYDTRVIGKNAAHFFEGLATSS